MTMIEEPSMLDIQPSLFVGHEEILQSLRETLLAKHVVVLTGARDSGKTALAREYARRFAHEYEQVLWLDMATPESLLTCILAQGQRFPLPEEALQKGFAGISEMLATWANQWNALLVFDTISWPELPAQTKLPYRERTPRAHMLLIEQDEERLPTVNSLVMRRLTAAEGARLVALSSTQDDAQHRLALELARELSCLPLALTLARGYLDVTGCGLQDYLFAYRDCPARPGSSSDRATQTLEIACDLTLARLAQSQSAALLILQACALLSSCAIPRALFMQDHLWPEVSSDTDEAWANQLREALQALLNYRLLEMHDETDTLTISPLLTAVLHPLWSQEQRQAREEQLMIACLRLARAYERAFEQKRERGLLAPLCALAGHIRALANGHKASAFLSGETAEACLWSAQLLGGLGLVREGEPLLSKALHTWEQIPGSPRTSIADTLFSLAVFYAQLQHYPVAETYGLRAITVTAEALGPAHPGVLGRLNILADIYRQQGKLKEARLCYEKVISIGERAGLQQHSSYRSARISWLKLKRQDTTSSSGPAGASPPASAANEHVSRREE